MRLSRLLIVVLVLVLFNLFEPSKARAASAPQPAVVANNTWFLRSTQTPGYADLTFTYGTPSMQKLLCAWDASQPGVKLPVAVEDRDGVMIWFLRNTYSGGDADLSFAYGSTIPPEDGVSTITAVCGDWDGDGIDTPGVIYKNEWFIRNSQTNGPADLMFTYGFLGAKPLTW